MTKYNVTVWLGTQSILVDAANEDDAMLAAEDALKDAVFQDATYEVAESSEINE